MHKRPTEDSSVQFMAVSCTSVNVTFNINENNDDNDETKQPYHVNTFDKSGSTSVPMQASFTCPTLLQKEQNLRQYVRN
jgi:hypothetical protein